MSRGWFVSGHSTAAGVIVEFGTSSGANSAYRSKQLVLRGYMFQNPSSIAASTAYATLRMGESSAVGLSSQAIANVTPEVNVVVTGLNIPANYFAIAGPATKAEGFFATIWGDYV